MIGSKRRIFSATECVSANQGHPRSLILASVESAHATSCYEIQYTWTARSTETETETGLDRYVMLGARWLTEY